VIFFLPKFLIILASGTVMLALSFIKYITIYYPTIEQTMAIWLDDSFLNMVIEDICFIASKLLL
jgi:hypothetical protein